MRYKRMVALTHRAPVPVRSADLPIVRATPSTANRICHDRLVTAAEQVVIENRGGIGVGHAQKNRKQSWRTKQKQTRG